MAEDLSRQMSATKIDDEVMEEFRALIKGDVAVPVCAMKALVTVIKRSRAATWMQLELELRGAISSLKNCPIEYLGGRTNISLGSGCDLFMKYVTRAFLEYTDFRACREELLGRGEKFTGMSMSSRSHIANIGHSFVRDGCTVLTFGCSRVVTALLLKAAESKQFNIVIPEGRPQNDGYEAAKVFSEAGIPTSIILDCAVGSYMEKVHLCITGAEGVMENGGIVNKLGTYQMAIVAKTLKKPFYVAVESYKFSRMYPLGQRDVTDMCVDNPTATSTSTALSTVPNGVSFQHPKIDFTPAEYITLLFTDLGVLTPAAVSDELIRLYQ
eukprot:gene10935-22829_t